MRLKSLKFFPIGQNSSSVNSARLSQPESNWMISPSATPLVIHFCCLSCLKLVHCKQPLLGFSAHQSSCCHCQRTTMPAISPRRLSKLATLCLWCPRLHSPWCSYSLPARDCLADANSLLSVVFSLSLLNLLAADIAPDLSLPLLKFCSHNKPPTIFVHYIPYFWLPLIFPTISVSKGLQQAWPALSPYCLFLVQYWLLLSRVLL